jgi:hypothetical protein
MLGTSSLCQQSSLAVSARSGRAERAAVDTSVADWIEPSPPGNCAQRPSRQSRLDVSWPGGGLSPKKVGSRWTRTRPPMPSGPTSPAREKELFPRLIGRVCDATEI